MATTRAQKSRTCAVAGRIRCRSPRAVPRGEVLTALGWAHACRANCRQRWSVEMSNASSDWRPSGAFDASGEFQPHPVNANDFQLRLEDCSRCTGTGRNPDPGPEGPSYCGRCEGYGVLLTSNPPAPLLVALTALNTLSGLGEDDLELAGLTHQDFDDSIALVVRTLEHWATR